MKRVWQFRCQRSCFLQAYGPFLCTSSSFALLFSPYGLDCVYWSRFADMFFVKNLADDHNYSVCIYLSSIFSFNYKSIYLILNFLVMSNSLLEVDNISLSLSKWFIVVVFCHNFGHFPGAHSLAEQIESP